MRFLGGNMEYILYCDESCSDGPKFSDFFCGCLVSSKDLSPIASAIEAKKQELNLFGEIKWTKVTDQHLGQHRTNSV